MMSNNILRDISLIRQQWDTQKRTQMLLVLNDSLPAGIKLELPSLVTNAFVRHALDILEDRIRSSSTG
jgi:hypothetical protein